MKSAVCVLIVNRNNEFLSVSLKEDHTDFNLPGGKVEENETNINACIREVKEETGLDVNNIGELYEDYDEVDGYQVYTNYANWYSGRIHTVENHVVKCLPIKELTNSKKWKKEIRQI